MNRASVKKLALVGCFALLLLAFFALDLGRFFTLDYLKSSRAEFMGFYQGHTLAFMAVFFALYVAVTALSLPVAAVLSLAGAAIMGFWPALLLVSFASTLGATIACAAARYVLRDSIRAKFGQRLAKIDAGVKREGAFYLFSLRLLPIFPFFVINLVFGLTELPLTTFYWVSQLGMLPGTAVYVNAGTQLGQIDSLSGILSPAVLGSFVLLGLFPLLAKKAMALLRRARGLAPAPPPSPPSDQA